MDLRYIRLLIAVFAVLASVVAIAPEVAEIAYAHAPATAELPVAGAETVDGEEHPQPDVSDDASTTRRATHSTLVVGPRPLIIDGRSFRPPLQYRLQV